MKQEGFTAGVDGSPLYYRVLGKGEPTLMLCDGVGCAGYAWRYIIEYFRDRHRIVHWHYRGHGLSGAPRDLIRLEISDHAEDARLLMDHLDISRAVLVGHSMGVQVILEIYRHFADRVTALVPMCGSYGNVLDTFHDSSFLKRIFPYIYRLATGAVSKPMVQAFWGTVVPTSTAYALAETVEINPRLVKEDDFRPYLEHLGSMDVEVFARCLAGAARHSAEDVLGAIAVPTLVIAAEHDGFTPVWLSQKMHEQIPNAEMLFMPSCTHTAPIEMPDLINLRIDKFLREQVQRSVEAAAE